MNLTSSELDALLMLSADRSSATMRLLSPLCSPRLPGPLQVCALWTSRHQFGPTACHCLHAISRLRLHGARSRNLGVSMSVLGLSRIPCLDAPINPKLQPFAITCDFILLDVQSRLHVQHIGPVAAEYPLSVRRRTWGFQISGLVAVLPHRVTCKPDDSLIGFGGTL